MHDTGSAIGKHADRQKEVRERADLYVGIDGGCINDRPVDHTLSVHDRHGHEAINERASICLLQEDTDG